MLPPCPCGRCTTDPSLQQTHQRWRTLLSILNEQQTRLFAADKALELGRGGIRQLSLITGLSARTIERGIHEFRQEIVPVGDEHSRRPGGGRKPAEEHDPGLRHALETLLEESTAGDPMSLLRWSSKSLRTIASLLTTQGHPVSHLTVWRLLRSSDYSLRGNVKALEGKQDSDRDAQFRYLHEQAKVFLQSQQPVISVDTKKKEKVGEFANPGRQWRREDRLVNIYDFSSLSEGPAIPYGIYDEQHNEGFVNVGMTHDTAEFAVESIQRWWQWSGQRAYPQAKRLLITADGGGSNGSRPRLWKRCLQRFADQYGLDVTVCHYPPGTSKWNKIEHRLFSFISIHWRGEPLTTYETIIELISHTTTKKGLRVTATLDEGVYKRGIKISDKEMETLYLEPHEFHPKWNYTIHPRTQPN
jgi:hypothetical protein